MNRLVIGVAVAMVCALCVPTALAQCGCGAQVAYAPAVDYSAYYAPTVSYYAPAASYAAYYTPTVSYYAPAASCATCGSCSSCAPCTSCAPCASCAAPTVSYYAPAVSYAAYYTPTVSYYTPAVSYASYYTPYTTYYAAGYAPYGVVGSSIYGTAKVYVPGEPVRNALRAVTP